MSNIPVIHISEDNISRAWENAVITTWESGIPIKTEYDKPEDPPSRDCTMIMEIKHPMSEPRIHRAFPAGLEDLEIYRQEVLYGVHDSRVDTGGWWYSYYQRLFKYPGRMKTDQIAYIVRKLSQTPYSRRAQAVTWNVDIDPAVNEPPCLLRVWCRIIDDEGPVLNMNTHWRSRDAYKAAFMNVYVMTLLQQHIAERIGEKIKRVVRLGRYVDISDSFHIYGSYYEEFKGFLETLRTRTFEERTWDTEFAQPIFDEAAAKLRKEQQSCEKSLKFQT